MVVVSQSIERMATSSSQKDPEFILAPAIRLHTG